MSDAHKILAGPGHQEVRGAHVLGPRWMLNAGGDRPHSTAALPLRLFSPTSCRWQLPESSRTVWSKV